MPLSVHHEKNAVTALAIGCESLHFIDCVLDDTARIAAFASLDIDRCCQSLEFLSECVAKSDKVVVLGLETFPDDQNTPVDRSFAQDGTSIASSST